MLKRITSIQLPQDLIDTIDAQVAQEQRALGGVANVSRGSMMRALILLGLERRAQLADYSRDEQRQEQAREQRQAASAG